VAEAGLEELIKLARPGIDAGTLYTDMLARLLELRSEYFPLTLTIDSIDTPKPRRHSNPPLGLRLEANALITNEVNAIRGAQLTQVSQPILLGKVPEAWKPVIDLHREVYEAGLARIKPGEPFGALIDFVAGLGAKRGMKAVARLHGCGYGDDGPLLPGKISSDALRDLTMEQGNVFVWKPLAMSADGKIQFSSGGPLLVTERGCENLFTRPHGMVAIA
jgi:Xaa-Pro aminopeptidase